MLNADKIKKVTTWSTRKTAHNYAWNVSSYEGQQPKTLHYNGMCKTRAQAAYNAKKFTRVLNSIRKQHEARENAKIS